MGFKNDIYATVWNDKNGKAIDLHDNYADIVVTTSKKVRGKENEFETDFRAKVRFLSNAFQTVKSANLAEKDRLHLLQVETTTKYDKEKNHNYINFICWECEIADKMPKKQPIEVVDEPNFDSAFPAGDLPF